MNVPKSLKLKFLITSFKEGSTLIGGYLGLYDIVPNTLSLI